MYNVVFRTITERSITGAITWIPFRDIENFNKQYSEKMREWYEVIEQNVSKERAVKLCSIPVAALVVVAFKLREF